MGYTGLLLCACWIVDEIHRGEGHGKMTIEQMRQSEAVEIADRWKYDGEYAFYDMTADPEDYREITTPALRDGRYYLSNLDRLNDGAHTLTAWYDKAPSQGGGVRVIIGKTK